MKIDIKTTDEITKRFQLHGKDTGSVDIQIAIISEQIIVLSEELQSASSYQLLSKRLELLRLIGRRRKLLSYLNSTDTKRYHSLITRLNLKK